MLQITYRERTAMLMSQKKTLLAVFALRLMRMVTTEKRLG